MQLDLYSAQQVVELLGLLPHPEGTLFLRHTSLTPPSQDKQDTSCAKFDILSISHFFSFLSLWLCIYRRIFQGNVSFGRHPGGIKGTDRRRRRHHHPSAGWRQTPSECLYVHLLHVDERGPRRLLAHEPEQHHPLFSGTYKLLLIS